MELEDLQESWQLRAMRATRKKPIGMVVLSMIAHSFDRSMLLYMHLMFPGFQSITTPFICSAAKISKAGAIVADVVWSDYEPITKNAVIFRDTDEMRTILRHLADRLKLNDDDRRQMFIAATNWVTADQRIDPTMDPRDPDARRLTLN